MKKCHTGGPTSTELQNQPTTTLKNIARLKGSTSQPDLIKVVHASVFSRLDYCNSVFAACSVALTRTKKVDHITPVLRALKTIYFKILLLTYRALNGLGP